MSKGSYVIAIKHPELGECYATTIKNVRKRTADLNVSVDFNKATIFNDWNEINKIRKALPYDNLLIAATACTKCNQPYSISRNQQIEGHNGICPGCSLDAQRGLIDRILDGRSIVLVGMDEVGRKVIFSGWWPHQKVGGYEDWIRRADWFPVTDDLYVPATNIYHFENVGLAADFVRKINCTKGILHIHAFPEDICSLCKKKFIDNSRKLRPEKNLCHECRRKYSTEKTKQKLK